MRRFALWVLLILLVAPVASFRDHAAAESPSWPYWWGPTEPDRGYHIRMPVVVRNDMNVTLQSPVAKVQIDLAEELADAGWPSVNSGGRAQPAAFELDSDSIRVVAMTNLMSPSPGTFDGRPAIYDATAQGLNQYVAPSAVVPGVVDQAGGLPFDAQVNPAITVFWLLRGAIEPVEPPDSNNPLKGLRFFYVYFDTARNPGHELTPPTGVGAGAVSAIHGGGPGTLLYGFVPPPGEQDDTPSVTVMGLYNNTRVQVELDRGGFQSTVALKPFPIDANVLRKVPLPASEDGTAFRLQANLPILAFVAPEGFVPSVEGGYAGNRFLFVAGDEAAYFADAGRGAPTTIEVQPLEANGALAGNPLVFHLNDDVNPFPHTVGTWASGQADSSCRPQTRAGDAPPLERGRFYLAQVKSGGPVVLQQGRSTSIVQVPAIDGGTLGRTFMGVVSDTPFQSIDGRCTMVQRNREWFVVGATAGTARVDSPGSSGSYQTRPVSAAPDYAGPFGDGRELRNRPVTFNASGPTWLWLGSPSGAVVPSVIGPLGGKEAREFAGIGEAVVFGLYNETQVLTTEKHARSGTVNRLETLAPGGSYRLRNGASSDYLLSFHLVANHPVAVYPTSRPPGLLAGLPLTLRGEVYGSLEFRGHMIGIGPAPGTSLAKATVAGASVNYTLRITNLGRDASGGALPDVVDLSVGTTGEGWAASLDRTVVALGGAREQDVTLTVHPPSDAGARTQAVALVTAASRGNPDIVVSEKATTYLKRVFAVGVWFDLGGGPKSQTRPIDATASAEFVLAVRNEGTVQDRILLSVSPPERGWTVVLHDDQGVEVDALDLDARSPQSTRMLRLRVTPPPMATNDVLITTVTASSATQPAAFDRVTATTKVAAPSNLSAEIRPMTRLALPGEEASFELLLKNRGEGPAEVRLENRTDAPLGWPTPATFIADPVSGGRVNLDRLTVGPGETARIGFAQRIPVAGLAGEAAHYRIAGYLSGGVLAIEVFPAAVVASFHLVKLEEALSVTVAPGTGLKNVTLRLGNAGNLDELFHVRPGPVPTGWSLVVPQVLAVPTGQEAAFTVVLEAAAASPAGRYNLSVLLDSEDGVVQTVDFAISILRGSSPFLAAVPAVKAQPGLVALAQIPVENRANVPVVVRVEPAEGEAWPLAPSDAVRLEADANASLAVAWQVPRKALDGLSRHHASVVFEPDFADASTVVRTVEVDIEVGRPRLSLSDASAIQTPGGRLVRFNLSNAGNRSAEHVNVELHADGYVRDRLGVEVLAPGESAHLALLDAVGKGFLRIVVDPDRHVMLPDGAVNEIDVKSGPLAPTPSLPAGLAILIVAMMGALSLGRGGRSPPLGKPETKDPVGGDPGARQPVGHD